MMISFEYGDGLRQGINVDHITLVEDRGDGQIVIIAGGQALSIYGFDYEELMSCLNDDVEFDDYVILRSDAIPGEGSAL